MRCKTTSRWRVLALVITFGLGSLNAAACPILMLCRALHGTYRGLHASRHACRLTPMLP